jgi:hypothetical protein
MRRAVTVLIAILFNIAPISIAPAAPAPFTDLASPEAVLRWINTYRTKPDPGGVPAVVKALSRLAAFKDPESSGAYVGFMAGVIAANRDSAEELIAKMFPLPEADQWAVVRAIAYSGHPQWQALLRKFAERMPSRKVMIDKYLAGKLPTLYQVSFDNKTSTGTRCAATSRSPTSRRRRWRSSPLLNCSTLIGASISPTRPIGRSRASSS